MAMRAAVGGYAFRYEGPGINDRGKIIRECETVNCGHTQTVIHVPPRALGGLESVAGWCGACNRPIRKDQVGKPCKVWEVLIEEIERDGNARQAMLRDMGLI